MTNFFLFFVLVLCACIPALAIRKILTQRIQVLEQELQHISNAVSQMAEMQLESHSKLSTSIEGLEERVMELSVPSHDTILPLERRHQVMTLARRGMSLEDIVKRLKAPIGEAELILNLGKYSVTSNKSRASNKEQVRQYA